MSRADVEQELLEDRFPYLTSAVRELIVATARANKCADTDDVVVDDVWTTFGNELCELLEIDPGERLNRADREKLRTYLDQGLELGAHIEDISDDDLDVLFRQTRERRRIDRQVRQNRSGEMRDRWDFFNDPDADADMDYWRKSTGFSPDEAVALSFGKLPDQVNEKRLKDTKTVGFSPFRAEYAKRLDLVRRAIATNELNDPIERKAFIDWAWKYSLSNALDVRPGASASHWEQRCYELEKRLVEVQNKMDDSKPYENLKGLTTRKTVFKLILGIAVKQFGHVVGTIKSDATGPIFGLLKQAEDEDRLATGQGNFIPYALSRDSIVDAIREAEEYLRNLVTD